MGGYSPPPVRLNALSGNNSMSSLSLQSEIGRPAAKKRSADPERGGSRKAQKTARSTYATWRQDPYLDRDEDGDLFPAGKDEDIFEDDIDERHTRTTGQREAYKRDMSVEERYITEQHRLAFMARAFPDAQPLGDDVPHQARVARIRMCRARADFEAIINIVDNWRPELKIRDMEKGPERDNLNRFRQQNPRGNKLILQYSVTTVQLPGTAPQKVLRKLELHEPSGEMRPGRIVVCKEEVFDCIHDWHKFSSHLGEERSWRATKGKYYNISQELIKHYCKTCLACNKKNQTPKATKGSRKPIRSAYFRDRFQVDLIDMRKLRKRDPFGVLMRWILTLKDHSTGLVYLTALPRKRADGVAYKLQEIFGVLGYPRIFHTDNGKEFTAKVVLEFLRMMNPNILAVTGRARQPQDQGSVENMNKFVKRNLHALLSEQRSYGNNPNWTTVLGAISASINSAEGRGPDAMNPYEAVYGQKMDHMVMCTKDQARACWTLPEILKVTADPEFQEYAEDNYFLADEEDNNDVDDDGDADGYFSDGSLPREQMDEVDDDFFFGHILEDLSDAHKNLNARPIGDEGIVDDVPHVVGVLRPHLDENTAVVGGSCAAFRPDMMN
jgi:hypothetical protein